MAQPGGAAPDPVNPLAPYLEMERGRARFAVDVPPLTRLDPVPDLLVGVSAVDITPPPGMPKAGYSSNAFDGAGFRTRLSARVFHIRAATTSIAVVACDLLGGSSVVQHLVAERIRDLTDVPLAGLFIGATHTHAGPGQFLGTDFYNRFASNRGGFDPAFTDWLVNRIAGAVIGAVEGRQPGRVAVGSTDVFGLTRNRSHGPHVNNATVMDKRTEPQRKYVDVNPRLDMVRLDDSTGTPLGALSVFSVHGTGISVRSRTYNADVWAYLCSELDHRIEESYGVRAVVGAIEGTHADVAPAIRPTRAGHVEAERVGRGIGAAAAELFGSLENVTTNDVDLGCGLSEVDLDQSREIDGVSLPSMPAVGAALVAGAHENTTPVIARIPPFRPGMPKPWSRHNPQGSKWVLGSRWLQPLILPERSFPRVIPVHALRIAESMLVGLPFEVTVESGRRIAAAVAGVASDHGIVRVIVSSVANEYCGYAATPEEYARQHYEGGHTLYGPDTVAFLAGHARRLASRTLAEGGVSDVAPARSWDLRVHRYLPRSTGRRVRPVARSSPRFVDATPTEDPYWEFGFRAAPPGDLDWGALSVSIERSGPDGGWTPQMDRGRQIDDRGTHVEVVRTGADDVGHLYTARWHAPRLDATLRHRFVVRIDRTAAPLYSPAFD